MRKFTIHGSMFLNVCHELSSWHHFQMFSTLFWGKHPGPQLIDGLCVVAMVSDVGLGCRNLGGVGGERFGSGC